MLEMVSRAPPQVLVMEDDEGVLDVLDVVLTDSGYAVHPAHDGRVGLELLVAGLRPQLIVLDLLMPRMCGRDVLAALRAPSSHWATIPVLVLSGAQRPALPEGVALLRKPFEVSELLSRVDSLVAQLDG